MASQERKIIRTAVLGMGMSATVFHIPFILSLPSFFVLHTILERSATPERSAARDRYGSTNVKIVTSYQEVLADKDVDLIVISTPNATHYPYAKAALSAGKHVIIEKPLVTETTLASELIELAAERSLVLATYQNRRWDSDFLTVQRLINVERVLGDISEFETHYDRWRPNLKGNGTWKEEAQWGHGVVFDLGSHLIDQVLTIFGTPDKVFGHVSNSRAQGPAELDDAFIAHFFYRAGSVLRPSSKIPLTVTIRASSLSMLERQVRFVVKGTKGSFVKYGLDVQEDQLKFDPPLDTSDERYGWEPKENEGELTVEEGGMLRSRKVATEKGDYLSWYVNVGEAIQAGDAKRLIVKPEQAREVIRMIEVIYRSHREGRAVETL